MNGTPRILAVPLVYPSRAHPERGTFCESLVRFLRKSGARVDVLTPYTKTRALLDLVMLKGWDFHRTTSDPNVQRVGFWSVPHQVVPAAHLADRWARSSMGRRLRGAMPADLTRYDFVYPYFLVAGLPVVELCRKQRVPCIVELGESEIGDYADRLGAKVLGEALRRFSGFIAVSRANEEWVRRWWPDAGGRVAYIPNGIDTGVFTPRDRLAARNALGLPPEQSLVAFCGHFIHRKGPGRVIRALESLDGVGGLFLGQGEEIPRGPRVLFAGAVQNDAVPVWLSAADLFVLPSLEEGMSVAILEAMACGLPLVISDRPFNRSFLDARSAVFVDPEDPAAIAEGIRTVISNPERAARMGRFNLELSRKFSLEKRAGDVLDFVRSLAEGPPCA